MFIVSIITMIYNFLPSTCLLVLEKSFFKSVC